MVVFRRIGKPETSDMFDLVYFIRLVLVTCDNATAETMNVFRIMTLGN
jgi:hypothetical protein